MKYKNFEDLTYEEKLKFVEDQFNISELDVFSIEEVVTYCYNHGLLNNAVVKGYETVQTICLDIAIRKYTEYNNLVEAYIDCTSTISALCELEKIYITLNNSEFKDDLGNLIKVYEDKYDTRGWKIPSFFEIIVDNKSSI